MTEWVYKIECVKIFITLYDLCEMVYEYRFGQSYKHLR